MIHWVMFVNLIIKQLIQSLLIAGVLPAVLIGALSNGSDQIKDQMVVPEKMNHRYEVCVLDHDGNVRKMELENYVTGVLLAEVSPDFHMEALKAQAVATRTYTLYCTEVLKKHSSGSVCTDYHCCQAYCDPEAYMGNVGTEQGLKSVMTAVEETAGEVLRYGTDLICATYFACSGGQTEDAQEVWGESYPYLKSVESQGEENCGYFSKNLTMTHLELQEKLDVQLKGKPSSWFGIVKYTVGGGVDLMRIGGKLYTGVELRDLLNLRSTVMTIKTTDNEIVIETKGYGHRVGMSQHGANAMASRGGNYREILTHYYANTRLDRI